MTSPGFIAKGFKWSENFSSKYNKYFPVSLFLIGFLFDILTLGRIDALFSILKQSLYLTIIGFLLCQWLIESFRSPTFGSHWMWFKKIRLFLLHFLFGSLLSEYMLFYFKSSSFSLAFIFIFLLATLLLLNEWHRFQKLGLIIKFALFTFCSMSFFSYLVPIALGQTGKSIFLGSLVMGLAPLLIISHVCLRCGLKKTIIRQQSLIPGLFVMVVLFFLYTLRWIPPVPLSIQYIGVFHTLNKVEGKFQLGHERPWWRFWHHGDQVFLAQPGDKIVIFFRLFSPTHFKDEVRVKWYLDNSQHGWVMQDEIPIRIIGGREEGFRGYAQKSHFTEGQWKVAIETLDEREIGRIYLQTKFTTSKLRSLQFEIQ
ncbi:MAG: DUF2914 domain-containing protein [Bdellovibrionales bacterium]|nr:DUF2914 domain-containing protein [Bdellovibrionales bacterium]